MNSMKYGISHYKQKSLIIILVLLLTACQGAKIHQTYEGPAKPVNEISILSIPESFNVLFIDKKKYGAALYSNDTKLSFLPGPHHIVIYYKDFWEIPGDEHERVESKPISIKFTAQPGQQYRVNFKKPANVDGARAFAENPAIEFINLDTKTSAATTIEYNIYTRSFFMEAINDGGTEENKSVPTPSTTTQPAPAATASVTTTGEITGAITPATPTTPTMAASKSAPSTDTPIKEDVRALDMLKYWWETASDKQKKEFQDWVKQ